MKGLNIEKEREALINANKTLICKLKAQIEGLEKANIEIGEGC